MNIVTKESALRPGAKRIGQGLVLLSLLALLGVVGVVGASMSHSYQAAGSTGVWMAPGPSTTPPPLLAASEGDIHIGS